MPHNFYQVHHLQQEAGKIGCSITYNAAHPIFAGHFPAQPVVPGVCTMDMIKELLEAATGKALLLRSTGQVKFLQLILPEVKPEVSIAYQDTGTGYQVAVGLKADGRDLFKMNALFDILP